MPPPGPLKSLGFREIDGLYPITVRDGLRLGARPGIGRGRQPGDGMHDDQAYDDGEDGGFDGPRDPLYDAATQQGLDQIRVLRAAGLEQAYRDALHLDCSAEAEVRFWRTHGLPMHLLRPPALAACDAVARDADRVPNRGYRRLSQEAWQAAGKAYLEGDTAEAVSARYGMGVSTFRARAREEGWRREDQDDPSPLPMDEPIDLPFETAQGLPDFAEMAAHALVRMGRAVQAGRAMEAARWVRLHAHLTRLAREAEPPATPSAARPEPKPKEPDMAERATAVAREIGVIALEAAALTPGDYAGRDALMARMEALDDLKPSPTSDELHYSDGVFSQGASETDPP